MDRWIVVELVAIAVLLRVIALGDESLWFDEAYSVAFAGADLSLLNFLRPGGFAFTDKNVYHILLHFWLGLGRTEFVIRLLSVIFGVATMLVVLGVARRLFGGRAAAWAAGLLAVSPFHIWYSREARMYVLAGLFAWLAVLAVLEAVQRRRALALWGMYALCAALGLYTHTFSIFVVAAVNVWVAVVLIVEPARRKMLWPWLGANAALVALAVPWFLGISAQQSQGWWAWIGQKYGTPGLKQLLLLPVDFALGTIRPPWLWALWLGAGCFGLGLLLGAVPPSRRRGESWWQSGGREWACAMLLMVLPATVAFALAQVRPMFVLRYMVPFAPAFAIVAGRGFCQIRRAFLRWAVMIPYLAGVAAVLLVMYLVPQKEDWRGAAAYLAEHVPAGGTIFLVDEDIRVPLVHYYQAPADLHPVWRGHRSDADLEPKVAPVMARVSEFWLVVSHTDNDALAQYLGRFADVVERQEFRDIVILHFRRRGGAG